MHRVMRLLAFLAVLFALAPAPAFAQTISGYSRAVDGDTLEMTGYRVRLFGIDAVERGQVCDRAGEAWRCGEEAAALLAELVEGREVACEARDTDAYGRLVGVCRAGRIDLSAAMAGAGYAVALEDFSEAYLLSVDAARRARAGIWASEFAEPRAWRAENGVRDEAPRRSEPAEARASALAARAEPAGVYFRNCAEVRAAGRAPLYRGQPGYRPPLDADNDGVACEPYRGRR